MKKMKFDSVRLQNINILAFEFIPSIRKEGDEDVLVIKVWQKKKAPHRKKKMLLHKKQKV